MAGTFTKLPATYGGATAHAVFTRLLSRCTIVSSGNGASGGAGLYGYANHISGPTTWTTDLGGTPGNTVSRAWAWLKTPGGLYILIRRGETDSKGVAIYTDTVAPPAPTSAVDFPYHSSIVLSSGGMGGNPGTSNTTVYEDESGAFYVITTSASTGALEFYCIYDLAIPTEGSTDPDRSVFRAAGPGPTLLQTSEMQTARAAIHNGSAWVQNTISASSWRANGVTYGIGGMSTDPSTGYDYVSPVRWHRVSSPICHKGPSTILRWQGSAIRAAGSTVSVESATSREWIAYGDMLLPHDGTTVGVNYRGIDLAAQSMVVTVPGSGSDSVAPVVSNVTPTPGTAIGRHDALEFDVSDNVALRRVLVRIRYDDRSDWDFVFDGVSFSPRYAALSSVTISGGSYHFVLRRKGGWPAPPRLMPFPFDTGGNEAA